MRKVLTASLILFILLASTPAYALEPLHYSEKPLIESSSKKSEWFSWDKTNTKLHVPLTLLMIADLGQTLDIADNCQYVNIEVREHNPGGGTNLVTYKNSRMVTEANSYLGQCPTRPHAKQYFGWMLTAITGAVWASPPKLSYAIQGGVIGIQIYTVGGNYYAGVGIGF